MQNEIMYEPQQPIYYYDDEPRVQPTTKKFDFELDKQTIILCVAALVIGFLLGSLKRPIVLKA